MNVTGDFGFLCYIFLVYEIAVFRIRMNFNGLLVVIRASVIGTLIPLVRLMMSS